MKLNFKHLEILRKAAGGFKVPSNISGNALEKKRILELSEAGLVKLEAVDPEFYKEGHPPRYRSLKVTRVC